MKGTTVTVNDNRTNLTVSVGGMPDTTLTINNQTITILTIGVNGEQGIQGEGIAYFEEDIKWNTFGGTDSGGSLTTGQYNFFGGYRAGALNRAGSNNIGIGYRALDLNVNGGWNVALGSVALLNNKGSYNVGIGASALVNVTDGINNIGIGYRAGYFVNIGSGNVFLGNEAGSGVNTSNELFINNSQSSAPLIWGNFSTLDITLNADVEIIGTLKLEEQPLLIVPVNGILEYSNGHLLFTHGDRFAFVGNTGTKLTTTTASNTVAETTIFSYTLPADTLHADMRTIFSMLGAFSTDSAAESFDLKFKIGGVLIHTITVNPANGTDIAWRSLYEATIRTAGAAGTFIDFSEFSESGMFPLFVAETTTHNIDTTVDRLFEVTVTWGNAKAGNSFSCTQGDLTYKH